MKKGCPYGFGKTIPVAYEAAVEKISKAIQDRGFSILGRIDLQETLREELDMDFGRYIILHVCNALHARQAFSADRNIGLLLPCRIVIYEEREGETTVMAMDPAHIMDLLRNPAAIEAAMEVKEKLEAIMEEI